MKDFCLNCPPPQLKINSKILIISHIQKILCKQISDMLGKYFSFLDNLKFLLVQWAQETMTGHVTYSSSLKILKQQVKMEFYF